MKTNECRYYCTRTETCGGWDILSIHNFQVLVYEKQENFCQKERRKNKTKILTWLGFAGELCLFLLLLYPSVFFSQALLFWIPRFFHFSHTRALSWTRSLFFCVENICRQSSVTFFFFAFVWQCCGRGCFRVFFSFVFSCFQDR